MDVAPRDPTSIPIVLLVESENALCCSG
jgi:hypothetical protein